MEFGIEKHAPQRTLIRLLIPLTILVLQLGCAHRPDSGRSQSNEISSRTFDISPNQYLIWGETAQSFGLATVRKYEDGFTSVLAVYDSPIAVPKVILLPAGVIPIAFNSGEIFVKCYTQGQNKLQVLRRTQPLETASEWRYALEPVPFTGYPLHWIAGSLRTIVLQSQQGVLKLWASPDDGRLPEGFVGDGRIFVYTSEGLREIKKQGKDGYILVSDLMFGDLKIRDSNQQTVFSWRNVSGPARHVLGSCQNFTVLSEHQFVFLKSGHTVLLQYNPSKQALLEKYIWKDRKYETLSSIAWGQECGIAARRGNKLDILILSMKATN